MHSGALAGRDGTGRGPAGGSGPPVIAVVGGGITGLAAAWELCGAGRSPSDAAKVVLLEGSERLGGRLRTERFDGVDLDLGPDAFITRSPEALELCGELGLEDELVAPGTSRVLLWSRGGLRPLPEGLVLGVPTRLWALARSGLLSPAGLARASLEPLLPTTRPGPDVAVGEMVRARFGTQVDEQLVEPLIGGINAGSTRTLSLAAAAPQLDSAWRGGRSLLLGLRRRTGPERDGGPAFRTLRSGLGRLTSRLSEELESLGVDIRRSAAVGTIAGPPAAEAAAPRWRLSTRDGIVEADSVVVTTPAPVACRQLASAAPRLASELSGIEYSSVVLVSLSYDEAGPGMPQGATGFLVPRPAGRLMTACTFTSSKWPHLAVPGRVLVRLSAGRAGDDRAMGMGDDELVDRLSWELAEATGVRAQPRAARATRFWNSFPQYAVGHLQRVERVQKEAAALPGLAVAGAALSGLGIPACIAQGRRAARAVLDHTSGQRSP